MMQQHGPAGPAEPNNPSPGFDSPWPGSQAMPRWSVGPLVDAPRYNWRNFAAMLGPGLVMGGAAIGGGEWLTGPIVTAKYGGALFWLATLSILGQVIYNIEISRYTLYCGEPIFNGKFRTLPGPAFWLGIYILLDFGSLFPYLASSAATPLLAVCLGHIPQKETVLGTVLGRTVTEGHVLTILGFAVFLGALVPLIFGGKIYNSIKAVVSFKIVAVVGFLLFLSLSYSTRESWREIFSGFFRFGVVPVVAGEDTNGNGRLDPGEDWDRDGRLDGVEPKFPVLRDRDGRPAKDENGKPLYVDAAGQPTTAAFHDTDGDGKQDGDNVANLLTAWWRGEPLPTVDLTLLGIVCSMIAISGNGGLSNTPLSNYTRDQGWGMGRHVGAIPSVVGGHQLALSHQGMVFEVNKTTLPRWRRWYRHLVRDQVLMWMPACFIGLALPSILSVQFLPRGTAAEPWTAAGMTADAVQGYVEAQRGVGMGQFCWFMTLFCGFLTLAPTMVCTADGVIRRWVDVFWTSSPRLRQLDTKAIRRLFFNVMIAYAILGVLVLAYVPANRLLPISGLIYNYALGFSCLHTLMVNRKLLPRELRPGLFPTLGLCLAATFFLCVAVLTTIIEIAKYTA